MEPSENSVGWWIPAVTHPPSLDDAAVVAVDPDVSQERTKVHKSSDEKLKTNGFSPALFHPRRSCQVRQQSPITIPIPTPVLASENVWGSKCSTGPGTAQMRGAVERVCTNQSSSEMEDLGGV